MIKWEYFVHTKYFCTTKIFGVWAVFQSDVSIPEKVFVLNFFPQFTCNDVSFELAGREEFFLFFFFLLVSLAGF